MTPLSETMITAMLSAVPPNTPEGELRFAHLEIIHKFAAACVIAGIPTEILKDAFHRGKNEGLKILRSRATIDHS